MEVMLSTGIDIGTSTTQVIFSKLYVENTANMFSAPHMKIVNKEIIYKSQIYFTPLKSMVEIDADKLAGIVECEYKSAGISFSEVDTGAVIITGETARKQNAANVLDKLSVMAGDFVVTAAGPDLESVLSGRGAGAEKLSKGKHKCIANLDIGGGTTNISVFFDGRLLGVACLDIGGRLIKINDGKIDYIFPKIKKIAWENGIKIAEGDLVEEEKIRNISELMAKCLLSAVEKTQIDKWEYLYTNDGKPLNIAEKITGITFSGGVAEFIYKEVPENLFAYEDIGIYLGDAVKKIFSDKNEIYLPKETIRATVVGAGTYTTELSGSTIVYDEVLLPLKNLPVLQIEKNEEENEALFLTALQKKQAFFEEHDNFAIAFDGSGYSNFKQIQQLAKMLLEGTAKTRINKKQPLIVVTQSDIAKALGNALKIFAPEQKLVSIDGIKTQLGDYIDIGCPVEHQVLPVVVKTLIFNQ